MSKRDGRKCDVCNLELDGTVANFALGELNGSLEQLFVYHDFSAGMLLKKHLSAPDGGHMGYCSNSVDQLRQGEETRNTLTWSCMNGDIGETVKEILRKHPNRSKVVNKIIKELNDVAGLKPSNIFRSVGSHIRSIRDAEMKAGTGGDNPPKLKDGSYRCHVIRTVPGKSCVETTYILNLDIPALGKFEQKVCGAGDEAGEETEQFERVFATDDETFLVGYDIEYQKIDVKPTYNSRIEHERYELVSHQWWFNLAGVRFGIVFCTDLRITQKQFVEILDEVIPKEDEEKTKSGKKKPKKDKKQRTAFVMSYFSLIESGWMYKSDKIDVKKPGKKMQTDDELVNKVFPDERNKRDLIFERDKEWEGYTPIHGGKANLLFADAINLQRGGLKKLGETIGIKKIEHDHIEQMKNFRKENLHGFAEYGVNDCVIAAEALLYFRYMTKRVIKQAINLDIDASKTRITGYSAAVFEGIFHDHFGKDWKLYFGYKKNKGRVSPTLIHKLFVKHYYGGRNDVLCVGPRGDAYYHDLHSAYLTAVAMMADYNYSDAVVWSGKEAYTRAQELLKDGPYMPHGVTASFRFKKTVVRNGTESTVFPVFPVRIDDPESLPGVKSFSSDGLLFPRSGFSSFTWPEFWIAMDLGLLEEVIIHELVEFKPITDENGQQTWKFSGSVQKLLKERAKNENESVKAYLKAILNYLYGKSAQGITDAADAIRTHDDGKKSNKSKLSCYPLASYITGFCRATVGELLQLNDCYAITTDGFITPKHIDELVHGNFSRGVSDKLELYDKNGKPKSFISTEHSGNRSLFTKTRGYIILQDDEPMKIAAQGAQLQVEGEIIPESVVNFLQQLRRGYGDKRYWPSLTDVRKLQQKDKEFVPYKIIRQDVKIDMTYDFKHVPLNPEMRTFEYKGVEYPFVYFNTAPIETVMDFHAMRMLSSRRNDKSKYLDKFEFWKNYFNQEIALQLIDREIKIRSDLAFVIDMLSENKQLPPYMEFDDYLDMLEEYNDYRNSHMAGGGA